MYPASNEFSESQNYGLKQTVQLTLWAKPFRLSKLNWYCIEYWLLLWVITITETEPTIEILLSDEVGVVGLCKVDSAPVDLCRA